MIGKMTEQHMVGNLKEERKIGITCVSERKIEKGRRIGFVNVNGKENVNENENENEKENVKENEKENGKENVKGNAKRNVKGNESEGRRTEIERTNADLN